MKFARTPTSAILLIALTIFACAKGQSANEIEQVAKETLEATRKPMLVKIQVRLEKAEPPSADALETRRRIEERIEGEHVGTIVETTTDVGHYDIAITVKSTNESVPRVRTILRDEGVLERSTVRVESKRD